MLLPISGDSTDNAISFANVFSPRLFQRNLSRITPVQNITDDVSLDLAKPHFSIRNKYSPYSQPATDFASAYDFASTAPGSYPIGSVTGPINAYLQSTFRLSNCRCKSTRRSAVPSRRSIGRFSTYDANFTFLRDGSLQPAGTPSEREFRTEEYDFYVQDVWKIRRNLTVTAGLRYGLSRPVYEASGYEVKPNFSLSEIFERRADRSGKRHALQSSRLFWTFPARQTANRRFTNGTKIIFSRASPLRGRRISGKIFWAGCLAEITNRSFAAVLP